MANEQDYWDQSLANAGLLEKLLAKPAQTKRTKQPSSSLGLGTPSEDKNWFETAINTPIIKGILNGINTPSYSSANYAKYATASEADKQKKLQEDVDKGDPFNTALDLVGFSGQQGAQALGLIKGLSAGLGQTADDATSYSDVIKQAQNNAGIDTESPESQRVSGIGGFVGDVALDPTTYLGAGVVAHGVKGAVRGAVESRIAKVLEEGTVDTAGAATTKLKGAVEGAKSEIAKYRWDQWQKQEGKGLKKALRKNAPIDSYKETVEGFKFLPEKLLSGETSKLTSKDLKAAAKKERIFQKTVKDTGATGAEATDIIKKLVNGDINPQVAEAGLKAVANAAEEAPVGENFIKPDAPKTVGETVTTEKAPRASGAQNVPDSATITEPKKIIDDVPSEAKFSDYQNYTPVDRFVMGTEHLTVPTPKYSKVVRDRVANFIAQHPGTVNGVPDVRTINLEDLHSLGVKPEDTAHIMVNGNVEGLVKNSGSFKDIFKGIREGNAAPEDVTKFHDFMKGFTEQPDIPLHDAINAAQEFVSKNSEAIQKSSRSFAPTAVNGRLVNLNSGAGKSPAISMMQTLPSETASMFRRPLPFEQSQQYLGDTLEKTKVDIANGYLPAETAEIADKVLNSHFKEYSTPSGPFRTNQNWGTSTRRIIDGDPKKENWWTTNSAIDVFRKLQSEISAVLKTKRVSGVKYHEIQDSMFMRALSHIDTQLKGRGIFPYLTDLMPEGGIAIRASMYDVLEAMGSKLRLKYLFVPKGTMTNLRATQLMNVAEVLMRSIAGVEPTGKIDLAIIKPDAIRVLKGEYRELADERGIIRAINENLSIADKTFNDGIVEANIKGYKNAEKTRNKVYAQAFNDFVKINPDGSSVVAKLAETVLRNTSLHSSHLSHTIVMASDEALSLLNKALDSGSVGQLAKQMGDLMPIKSDLNPEAARLLNEETTKVKRQFSTPREEVLNDAQNEVMREAQIHETWADTAKNEKGVRATAEEVATEGKKLLPDGSVASTKWGKEKPVRNVKREKAVAKANAKVAARTSDVRIHPDNLAETVKDGGTDTIIDLARQQQAWDTATRMFGFQKFFDRQFGMRDSFAAVTAGIHFGTHLETSFHAALTDYSKQFTSEQINIGFKELQEGKDLSPAAKELQRIAGFVFDSSEKNFYARNGVGAAHMNSILNNNPHAPAEWRFPNVAPDQMASVWKAWTNVKNPLKMLAVVHTAMVKAAEDISMGARFSENFGLSKIPAGEEKLWVKVNNADGKNAFAKLIDTDLYYPREIVSELPALSHYITESRTFKTEWLNKFLTEVFDPFTSALKLTQTTMKPGHHVMSFGGDMLRNSLAGMNFSLKEYRQAWRIIRTRQAALKELSNLDQFARLKTIGQGIEIHGNGPGITLLIKGKKVQVADDSMWQLMVQKDAHLPGHSSGVAEDLLTTDSLGTFGKEENGLAFKLASGAAQGFNRGLTKLTNNRFIKLNKFSAERDNITRGALFLHFMQSKNFNSIEEAATYASEQIRKWAPTAKDLTAAESKSLRRIFFYYTWQRGILPRVIESAAMRPGWATMPSKAMYNLAVFNGLDPQSLGDPFPPEALMPDYYRQNVLGPTWKDDGHYWGFNPTSPVMDIMNSLGSGVSVGNLLNPAAQDSGESRIGKTLMGMLNPAFKAPIELSTQTSLSTGAPIVDSGEYATDMIGPARVASKITGHTLSLKPTFDLRQDIPRRTEAKFKNGIAPADWWNNAALETGNYLSGLQFKDYTADSAVKSAKYDQRAQVKKDRDNMNRTEWWR